MRRTDKEIADNMEISEIIRKCQVCRLAMSQDNMPYIVPLSFGYDENTIYFHSAVTGKKIDMLAANNHVCFEFETDVAVKPDEAAPCDWSFSFRSVIGFGDVEELSQDEDKIIGLKRIMAQYSDKQWNFETVSLSGLKVFKIAISSMTAKQSPSTRPA